LQLINLKVCDRFGFTFFIYFYQSFTNVVSIGLLRIHFAVDPVSCFCFIKNYKMTTLNQTIRKNKRFCKIQLSKTKALEQRPFKKGVCRRVLITSPKKPNSADRKIAKVWLSNHRLVTASIPGEGNHNLQQHSVVLVRGARLKDLPGVSYKLIRGVFDLGSVSQRRRGRSKYGTRKL
jgi:small subunit ribosomal protein S12